MYSQFYGYSIRAMATALPTNEINNEDYASIFGEQEVKRQIKVTGIRKRREAGIGQTSLDLAVSAAKKALSHVKWTGDELDVIVFASGYRNLKRPATSMLAHKLLGGKEDCIVFDVNLACTGTVDGVYTVLSILNSVKEYKKGLLIIGETPNYGVDKNDKSIAMLPCDCGSAIVVEKDNSSSKLLLSQMTDGCRYNILTRKDKKSPIYMDGMEVFQFAITDAVDKLGDFLKKYHIDMNDIDYFVSHQAQKFIVEKVASFAKIPKKKVLRSYHLFGNTGGSSDICTLCANLNEMEKDETVKILMTGFGAGLSCGIIYTELLKNDILPIEYTDMIWSDNL